MDQKLCLGVMDIRRRLFGGDGVVVALLTVRLHSLPHLSECEFIIAAWLMETKRNSPP